MLKRMAIFSLALATMVVGPSQAVAQPTCENLYLTHMYSDATHQVQVGYIWGECSYPHIRYYLEGTYTYFQVDELVGTCGPCGPIE